MKTSAWTLVKFIAISAVFTFVFHLLISSIMSRKPKPKPRPISPEHYKVISPATYKYILNHPSACEEMNPFLLIMVPVSPEDSASRDAIRKTWGAPGLVNRVDILTLFYVGFPSKSHPSTIQEDLKKENAEHADIIQMDFLDNYHNLTIKTLMIMNWIGTYCQSASFAMKVDSDIFVNVFQLTHLLGNSLREDYITGSVIADGRPRRDKSSKWFISEEVYAESRFPPYVSGAGYVFSTDLARRIIWASQYIDVIPLEDVYVGLCLRLIGVKPVYSRRLLTNLFEVSNLPYERCAFAKRVIVNGVKSKELLDIWDDFVNGQDRC